MLKVQLLPAMMLGLVAFLGIVAYANSLWSSALASIPAFR